MPGCGADAVAKQDQAAEIGMAALREDICAAKRGLQGTYLDLEAQALKRIQAIQGLRPAILRTCQAASTPHTSGTFAHAVIAWCTLITAARRMEKVGPLVSEAAPCHPVHLPGRLHPPHLRYLCPCCHCLVHIRPFENCGQTHGKGRTSSFRGCPLPPVHLPCRLRHPKLRYLSPCCC